MHCKCKFLVSTSFNHFHPEFLQWMLPSLTFDKSITANRNISQKYRTDSNCEDPDETARYEPSHLDLHRLH